MMLSPFQWSAFNYFGFYCAYGVLLPFLPVWLEDQGYDAEHIGLIIALGYLFRFCGGMLFSQRIKQASQLIPLTRTLAWLSVVAVIGVEWSVSSFGTIIVMIGIFHILNGGSMPINESIASTLQQRVGMDYGKARLFGSIAFVFGSLLTGYLVQGWGETLIIWILFAFLLMLASGQMLPMNYHFQDVPQTQQSSSMSYWQLFKQGNTAKILLAVSLIQASHAVYYTYSSIYWQSQDIATQSISWLWGLAVVAEIVLFFFATRIFKLWRVHHLIMLSTLGAMLRWVILANSHNFAVLVFAQMLHALSFGLSHYAMIRYIATQPSEHIAKLQGLYFALSNCALMSAFTLLAGLVYGYSASVSFWLMACLALPAIFIAPRKLNSKIHQSV